VHQQLSASRLDSAEALDPPGRMRGVMANRHDDEPRLRDENDGMLKAADDGVPHAARDAGEQPRWLRGRRPFDSLEGKPDCTEKPLAQSGDAVFVVLRRVRHLERGKSVEFNHGTNEALRVRERMLRRRRPSRLRRNAAPAHAAQPRQPKLPQPLEERAWR